MSEKPTPSVVIIHLAWSTLLSRACWRIFSGHTYPHVGRRLPRANAAPESPALSYDSPSLSCHEVEIVGIKPCASTRSIEDPLLRSAVPASVRIRVLTQP